MSRPGPWRAGALLPLLVAVGAALVLGPGPGGYWDSFDYLRQMATGDMTGGLLLGRTAFVTAGRGVWLVARWAGAGPDAAAWAVTAAVLATGAGAAAAMVAWVRALGVGDGRVAGLLWGLSPAVATLGFAAMSEVPAMALVLAGLAVSAGAWRSGSGARAATGAALVALSVASRETAVAWVAPLVLVPLLAPAVPRRHATWAIGGAAAGLGVALGLTAATFPEVLPTLGRWRVHMTAEAGRYPLHLGPQLRTWALWVLACAPVAAPLALFGGRALGAGLRAREPAALLAAWGTLMLLGLAFYQDLAWGPRFLVPAVPALCLLAEGTVRRAGPRLRTAIAVGLAGSFAVAIPASAPLRDLASRGRGAVAAVAAVPAGGVLIAGWLCPALRWQEAVGEAPVRELVCPGWTWPGADLARALEPALAARRPVFAVTDPALWPGERFTASLADVIGLTERGLTLEPLRPGLVRVRASTPPNDAALER